MKQDIENIIKKNLPENKTSDNDEDFYIDYEENKGFNQALSQINPSLIADEVLKVVVEKIQEELEQKRLKFIPNPNDMTSMVKGSHNMLLDDILDLLSNLSPNKENKNNEV